LKTKKQHKIIDFDKVARDKIIELGLVELLSDIHGLLHGYQWISMDMHRSLHGDPSISMDIHGSSMDLHGYPAETFIFLMFLKASVQKHRLYLYLLMVGPFSGCHFPAKCANIIAV
jgi:hypothetical protein